MSLKTKLIIVGGCIVTAIAVSVVAYNLNDKPENNKEDLVEVPLELNPTDTLKSNPESNEDNTDETVEFIDSKDFTYDPFSDDAGWGSESIFGNKIIINGSGKRDDMQGSQIVIGESQSGNTAGKNTRKLSAAEAQASLMEEVKSSDYHYRINEKDFSDGFGIYMNPKYELIVGRIMGDTGYISAPNGTEVGITELDNSVSIEEHRKKILVDSGYMTVYNYSKEPMFAYGTPTTFGVGIDDFENSPMYTAWRCNDESMNDYGGQLFCDDTMKSKFGDGYYIEMYNVTSGLYYGYYLVEHNGRIFKATGMSMYQGTLRDITVATIDTCVYPY